MTTTSTEHAVTEDTPMDDPAVRERLRELPPSAKLVARVLAEDGPMGPGALAERSLLPKRTVRYALSCLDDADLVEDRPSLQDARKQEYMLAG